MDRFAAPLEPVSERQPAPKFAVPQALPHRADRSATRSRGLELALLAPCADERRHRSVLHDLSWDYAALSCAQRARRKGRRTRVPHATGPTGERSPGGIAVDFITSPSPAGVPHLRGLPRGSDRRPPEFGEPPLQRSEQRRPAAADEEPTDGDEHHAAESLDGATVSAEPPYRSAGAVEPERQ